MNLKTMAMQVNEKNWSVAVAVLGNRFASIPQPHTLGCFLIINTFDGGYRRRGPMVNVTHRMLDSRDGALTLRNTWLDSEEFAELYSYDKRIKNLENFFEVTRAAEVVEPKVNKLDKAVRTLVHTYMGEDQEMVDD